MIDLEQLRVFYHIALHKNLTNAANALKINKSSASRAVQALEKRLKTQLFIRAPQGVKLTSSGELLLEKTKYILQEMKAIEEDLNTEDPSILKGTFRITTTFALASTWLTLFLHEFIEQHPLLRFEIVGSNAPLDLGSGEMDAAIRPFMENQPNLIQTPLMRWKLNLYASKKYVKKHGIPHTVQELDKHRLIVFGDHSAQLPSSYTSWPLYLGIKEGAPRKPFILINSIPGMYNLVQQGVGIGCFAKESPLFHKYDFVPILPDAPSTEVEIYYIYPESFSHLNKIRFFGEFLKKKSRK